MASSSSTLSGPRTDDKLPIDLIGKIICFHDICDMHSALRVNKAWREAAQTLDVLLSYRTQLETIIVSVTFGDTEERDLALELFRKHISHAEDETFLQRRVLSDLPSQCRSSFNREIHYCTRALTGVLRAERSLPYLSQRMIQNEKIICQIANYCTIEFGHRFKVIACFDERAHVTERRKVLIIREDIGGHGVGETLAAFRASAHAKRPIEWGKLRASFDDFLRTPSSPPCRQVLAPSSSSASSSMPSTSSKPSHYVRFMRYLFSKSEPEFDGF